MKVVSDTVTVIVTLNPGLMNKRNDYVTKYTHMKMNLRQKGREKFMFYLGPSKTNESISKNYVKHICINTTLRI